MRATLAVTACPDDLAGSEEFRNLDRDLPDRARCAEHEHALSLCQSGPPRQGEPGGQSRYAKRSHQVSRSVIRHEHRRILFDKGEGSQTAVVGQHAAFESDSGTGSNLVSLDHDADSLNARNVRKRRMFQVKLPRSDQEIKRVDRPGLNLDQRQLGSEGVGRVPSNSQPEIPV